MNATLRRETTINGVPMRFDGIRGRVSGRADFLDGREAVAFARCLKASGFAPRVLRAHGEPTLVVVNAAAADVLRLLA
jgi:hypothetical protein